MDRRVVIPQHMQEAMAQHMQQSMPANLRKYTQEGHGYIPQQAQAAIAQHMQKSMPAHMQKYVGAYVQQRVTDPHLTAPSVLHQSSPQFTAPSPVGLQQQGFVPHLPRQDHFHPSEQQLPDQPAAPITPEPNPYPTEPQQPISGSPAPSYPATPLQPPVSPTQAYDFITNPDQPARPRLTLPGGNSPAIRAAFAAGGLLVLLILVIIVKGLFSGSSNLTLFVGIIQDQQELIHLATEGSQQQGITTGNQNFAATTVLSLTSAQASIAKYLSNNGQKIDPKVINLKVSATTDAQLTTAAAATTYDQTFQEIMNTKVTAYISDLKQTYNQTSGKNGHALLKSDYAQAQLLLAQLNAPT